MWQIIMSVMPTPELESHKQRVGVFMTADTDDPEQVRCHAVFSKEQALALLNGLGPPDEHYEEQQTDIQNSSLPECSERAVVLLAEGHPATYLCEALSVTAECSDDEMDDRFDHAFTSYEDQDMYTIESSTGPSFAFSFWWKMVGPEEAVVTMMAIYGLDQFPACADAMELPHDRRVEFLQCLMNAGIPLTASQATAEVSGNALCQLWYGFKQMRLQDEERLEGDSAHVEQAMQEAMAEAGASPLMGTWSKAAAAPGKPKI